METKENHRIVSFSFRCQIFIHWPEKRKHFKLCKKSIHMFRMYQHVNIFYSRKSIRLSLYFTIIITIVWQSSDKNHFVVFSKLIIVDTNIDFFFFLYFHWILFLESNYFTSTIILNYQCLLSWYFSLQLNLMKIEQDEETIVIDR